jgi:actin-related protein 4
MAQMYCGDEVPAVVLDIGSFNCRVGNAGEAAPKHIFRSVVGEYDNTSYFGDSGMRVLRPMEVQAAIETPFSFFRDVNSPMDLSSPDINSSTINWDCLDGMLDYGINCAINGGSSISRKRSDGSVVGGGATMKSGGRSSADYSLFFTESHFDNLQKKQKLAEICFEKYSSPSFYMSSNAMLAALSMCKPTALVIDIGASGTTISPVVDGFALYRSRKRSPIGGDFFNQCIVGYLQQQSVYSSVKPWFDINNSSGSGDKQQAFTESFRRYHRANVIHDLKSWITVVPYTRLGHLGSSVRTQLLMDSLHIPPFVLPDGTNVVQSDMLVTTAECLFQKPVFDYFSSVSGNANNTPWCVPPLVQLIRDSLFHSGVDADVRKELLGNILVVGGGSLIDGVAHRLVHELTNYLNSPEGVGEETPGVAAGSGKGPKGKGKGVELAFKVRSLSCRVLFHFSSASCLLMLTQINYPCVFVLLTVGQESRL